MRSSAWMAAIAGVPGTTRRPASFITSAPTSIFLITCTRRSRIAEPPQSPAAAITARSPIAIGRRPEDSSSATSRPIPLNPNYVYAGGWYGTVLRYDKTTGQIVHLLTRSSKYRTAQMAPFAFSPQDPHTLYAAAQYVLKSNDGGFSWQEVSPDLTQKAEGREEET